MPLEAFKLRFADNVPGKFYVSNQCLDFQIGAGCAGNISSANEGGYSYVKKQPETLEEERRCMEALAGCCTATIYNDGDSTWGRNSTCQRDRNERYPRSKV